MSSPGAHFKSSNTSYQKSQISQMHLRSYKITSLTKVLSLCGLVRIKSRWPRELVSRVDITLKELQKVVKKYEVIGDASKRKRIWEKLKWSLEFKSIDSLRSKVSWPVHVSLFRKLQALTFGKLVHHNAVMNLLLTSIGKYVTFGDAQVAVS